MEDDIAVSLRNRSGSYGGAAKYWCCAVDLYNHLMTGQVTMTLCCERADPHHLPCVIAKTRKTKEGKSMDYCIGNGQLDQLSMSDKVGALNCMHDQQAVMTEGVEDMSEKTTVRRLTPLECERLQGFPDRWTDIGEWTDTKGKVHKPADTPRYKALGNSIATPFWQYLARRICAQYERDITMGSLFDGIGGFPYVFEKCGAKAVWASEIEEFPIAVTKFHFPEE